MGTMGYDTKTLEEQLGDILKEKKLTITTAESCTGGLLSGRIINVSGSSEYLKEAYITYCDEAKHKLLGVSNETLSNYTAVSAETAREMAIGGAKAAGADICLSVTGIAGPFGGTLDMPVGLVYIGCYCKGETTVIRNVFDGDRISVRNQAVEAALCHILQQLDPTSRKESNR